MSGWSNRPPRWGKPGWANRGEEYEAVLDQTASLTGSGWTSYTLTWSASVTPPTLGNTVVASHYRRAAESDLVIVRVSIGIGSTFSGGSGTYSWSMPFTATADWGGSIGALYVFDSGTAPRGGGIVKFDSTTTVSGVMGTSSLTNTSPQTWAVNDEIKFTIVYEAA